MVCIVDRSLSMARGDLFRKTRDKAESVLNLLQDQDEAALMWSSPQRYSEPSFTHYPAILKSRLSDTEVSWDRGDLYKAVQTAVQWLNQSQNINQEIFLISDFQKTGFSGTADSMLFSDWQGGLFLLPIEGLPENVGIVAAGVENAYFQPNDPIRIFGLIKNYGRRTVENLLIRVFIHESAVAQKVVQLEPGETRRITFRINQREKGWVGGSIQLDEDACIGDNVWYFSFHIPEKTSVLLLGIRNEDFRLLKLALTSHGSGGLFTIHQSIYGENWLSLLDQSDVVLFSNYPSLNIHELDRITQFIKKGGGLFIFIGDDVDLKILNSQFTEPHLGLSLINVTETGVQKNGYLTVGEFDFGHPIFSGMFEKGKENVRSPRFFRTIEIAGENGSPIISLGNGRPFLFESQYGHGKVFIAAGGIQDNWSNFGYTSIFAPIILRSTAYLASSSFLKDPGSTTGQSINLTLDLDDIEAPYYVRTPTGDDISLLPEISGGQNSLRIPSTDRPGIYRFYHGDTFLGMKSVNIDPRESDLTRIDLKGLEQDFPGLRMHSVPDVKILDSAVSQVRYGREFWRETLLLALLILILEMVLAYTGRTTQRID